ncbi:MAG: hypothetical protein ABIH26_12440 [Candidatus Eisenbacteria bacterium]
MTRLRNLPPLLLLLVPFALSCDNGIDTVDLDVTPKAPGGISVENGTGRLLLRWNFVEEVSPGVSFSGYKVYLKREGWDFFQVWGAFQTKPGSASYLPLLQERNSLADDRMEVWILELPNGKRHWLYVTGVQNGHEGPPSGIVDDVPYRLNTTITIEEETRIVADWYIPGYAEASFGDIAMDRVGYRHDAAAGSHFLRFLSAGDGGWLRLQNAGKDAGKTDAPTDSAGNPVGFHEDIALDRLEIREEEYVFVWDTGGTPSKDDDHFSRIWIRNIVDVPSDRKIQIDCAHQPRANTPNL